MSYRKQDVDGMSIFAPDWLKRKLAEPMDWNDLLPMLAVTALLGIAIGVTFMAGVVGVFSN